MLPSRRYCFSEFPQALGGLVFGFLTPKDFFTWGMLVCRSWTHFRPVWTCLNVTVRETNIERKALQWIPRAKLHVAVFSEAQGDELLMLERFSNLEDLRFESGQPQTWTLPEAIKSKKNKALFQSLKRISFGSSRVMKQEWWFRKTQPSLSWLQAFRALEFVTVPGNVSLEPLILCLLDLPNLQHFEQEHYVQRHTVVDAQIGESMNQMDGRAQVKYIGKHLLPALLAKLVSFKTPGLHLYDEVYDHTKLCPRLSYFSCADDGEQSRALMDFQKRQPDTVFDFTCSCSSCACSESTQEEIWVQLKTVDGFKTQRCACGFLYCY
jgi:hypothetical protein